MGALAYVVRVYARLVELGEGPERQERIHTLQKCYTSIRRKIIQQIYTIKGKKNFKQKFLFFLGTCFLNFKLLFVKSIFGKMVIKASNKY